MKRIGKQSFFLLSFLLFPLLQQLLKVIHNFLISKHSKLYQKQWVPFLHESYELTRCSVVDTVAVHVYVDQRRVLSQDLLDLLYHRDLF